MRNLQLMAAICLVVEHEGHHHVHLVFDDLAFVASHLVLLDPGPFDVTQRLGGPGEALWIASSKLFVEVALISETLATDMRTLLPSRPN